MAVAVALASGVLFGVAGGVRAEPPGDASLARTGDAGAVSRLIAEGYWSAHADSAAADGVARGLMFRLRDVTVRDEAGRALGPSGDEAAAESAWREWAGEPAARARIHALQSAVRRRLERDGFVFAVATMRAEPDSGGAPAVDIRIDVTRGPAFKLGAPVVRASRTRPGSARRLALWNEGDAFDPAVLEKGLARLRRTGYFEAADWTGLTRDAARYVLYPELTLPDASTNIVGGLLGYDSEGEDGGRLTGFLDIRLNNLRGTARDLAFAYDGRTGREREVRAAYTEPWILTLPVGARWEGRFLQQDTVFWEWTQDLFVFRDLGFNSRVEAEFGAQENRESLAGTGSRALRSGVRLVYDDRDRAPFTRRGMRVAAGLSGLRRTLEGAAGDSSYYLTQARAAVARWQPLDGFVERLGLRLGASFAGNYPLDRLNRGELHDVGGARSLRGYRERAFQTNAYLLGDAELYYAVGRRGRLFGFASPGLVNPPASTLDPRRVFGYGAGLELAQGDWSLSLTYALNPARSFGDAFLHAAVENRF